MIAPEGPKSGLPEEADCTPRPRRVEVRKPAVLVTSDGIETPVMILDLSAAGFRIHTEDPPLIGEFVSLRVDRFGDFAAQIRWCLGSEAGGVFLEPCTDADSEPSA